jgi:hypothetical protein
MPPRSVQGSDADRAEGGLDVEAEFAELDEATAARMGAEAEAQARQNAGPTAMEMLVSHVDGGDEDQPNSKEQE